METSDLISGNTFLIFNVDTYESAQNKPLALAEVVDKYSAFLKKFDEETLLIEKQSLIQLLDQISHYNFCLIDAKEDIEIDKVIEIIDLSDKWHETSVINKVGSKLFMSSHDDCYLYVETANEKLVLDLISLQIKTLVSKALNIPINDLNFNPKELINNKEFSIVIPQNPTEIEDEVSWKIYNATFRDFIYNRETIESNTDLFFFKTNQTIQIKKVRSDKTSD